MADPNLHPPFKPQGTMTGCLNSKTGRMEFPTLPNQMMPHIPEALLNIGYEALEQRIAASMAVPAELFDQESSNYNPRPERIQGEADDKEDQETED